MGIKELVGEKTDAVESRQEYWRRQFGNSYTYFEGSPTKVGVKLAVERSIIPDNAMMGLDFAHTMGDITYYIFPEGGSEQTLEQLDKNSIATDLGMDGERLGKILEVMVDANLLISEKRKKQQRIAQQTTTI